MTGLSLAARLRPSAWMPFFPAAFILMLLGCAEIAAPPGGEPDRTPPQLVASYPPVGALSVPADNKIVLTFTENITVPANTKAVFISPRPAVDPKVKVKGKEISITLDEFFRDNQTYVVTVNNLIEDLRRNKLTQPVTVAFSTGEAIDTGMVAGKVFDKDSPLSNAVVGLWSIESDTTALVFDSLYPDYTTTTNQQGEFTFQYLPERLFRLVAFKDANGNQRFEPAKETFALTDRPVQIGGELPLDSLRMSLTRYDSAAVDLLTVVPEQGELLRIRLSQPVSIHSLGLHPANVMLTTLDSLPTALPALGFKESDKDESDVITAYFGPMPDGVYRLEVTYDVNRPTLTRDTVAIQRLEDKQPPQIVRFSPGDGRHFLDAVMIGLTFSEPLDTTTISPNTFTLWQNEDTPVPVTSTWRDPFRLDFTPPKLTAGSSYRLRLSELDVVDRAGNRLGDSLASYVFGVLDKDSLGSISGDVDIALADRTTSPVILSFYSFNARRTYEHTVTGKTYVTDLPPGKYLISAIVDEDLNNRLSLGTLRPYHHAETFVTHPDTVSVRARFETGGVTIHID